LGIGHRASLLLTAFSWFVLGIWYGWGYCVCTDWHYMVLRDELGGECFCEFEEAKGLMPSIARHLYFLTV